MGTSGGKYIYEKIKIQNNVELEIFAFKYVSLIGGILFSNSPNNHNCFHKYERELLLVIITTGINVSGKYNFFMMEI